MAIYCTTQYTMHCDFCHEMAEVLNQGDYGNVWTVKSAQSRWRFEGWKIGKKHKCPNCAKKKDAVYTEGVKDGQ